MHLTGAACFILRTVSCYHYIYIVFLVADGCGLSMYLVIPHRGMGCTGSESGPAIRAELAEFGGVWRSWWSRPETARDMSVSP